MKHDISALSGSPFKPPAVPEVIDFGRYILDLYYLAVPVTTICE